jgi:hypothetical protein
MHDDMIPGKVSKPFRPSMGSTGPHRLLLMHTGPQSPEVKQVWHNGGHSPPSNTKLRTHGAIPPHHHTPLQYAPDNFYFSNGTITYTINLVMASITLHHSLTTHYNRQTTKQRNDTDTTHLWHFLNKNRLYCLQITPALLKSCDLHKTHE